MLSNQKRPSYLTHGHSPLNIYERPVEPHAMRGMNGVPETGPNGRVLERKPSRLEQMRADYQKKIMKEKEEKMVMMYEVNQRKAMDRIMRNDASPNGGKSVREFFNERRRMEASGAQVPNIDNHYRMAKGYNSPGGWSSRTGSGHSQKVSAGRDRSNPLAPIRRPMDTQEVSNHQRSRIPTNRQQTNNSHHGYEGDNPFNDKPKLVRHKPLPSHNGYGDHENSVPVENGYASRRQTQLKYNAQHNNTSPHPPPPRPPQQSQWQQQRQQNRPGPHSRPPVQSRIPSKSPTKGQPAQQQKMTDFQKWQMEQNKVREDRLKQFNNERHNSPAYDGTFGGRDDEEADEDDVEYEEEDVEDDIARQERELMEKIARQQAELDRVKNERHKLEQEEKLDRERQKKKEAMERKRQKQLEEEERKEEERRRREEEEDMKMEKQREEKRRKEMEKQRREDERRRKEEEKLNAKRQKEEERRMKEEEKRMREEEKRQSKQQAKTSPRKSYNVNDHHGYEESSRSAASSTVPHSSRTYGSPTKGNVTDRSEAGDFDERPAVANAGSNYYAQVAKSSEAKGSVGSLGRCRHCGRTFASDRLKKHQDACAKVQKPRKEFDTSKKRVEGTELAQYVGKSKHKEPPKKKSDWRAKREEFIQSLRYARQCAQVEKEGGDIRNLQAPPPSQNPDLVPCPYCNRTFNVTAAERHIPRCKDLKTKPPPINTRRR